MGIERRQFLRGLAISLGVSGITLGGYGVVKFAQAAERKKPAPIDGRVMYTCPMHPQILQDHPGNCPICNMTLVKVASKTASEQSDMVHVNTIAQQQIGVILTTATVSNIAHSVHAFANLTADESKVVSVNPKVEGWLRKVAIQGVGQPIRQGQVLYEIYSPELQQRQREYIDLLTRKDGLLGDSMTVVSSNSAMIGSLAKEKFRARARLLSADMSEELINLLEQSRRVQDVVAVRAEHSGTVTALNVHEGNFVNPMQQICTYAGTETVWAEVSLYPDQLNLVKNGDPITVRSSLDSALIEHARVALNTVQVDPVSRTAKLRFALKNDRGMFRPGTYAEVTIEAAKRKALQIPRDAVIRTGHGDFVVVAEAGNHFRRAKVTRGMESAENVVILAGLSQGDRVVANGQFLLDGAASMQALQARLESQL